MYISEIELKDFRNYKDIKVSFSQDINIFLGENAQGKTNLLEGIYLNAVAKSFKTSRDKDMIRFGSDYCQVRSVSFYDDEEHTSEIVISSRGAKAVKVDGVRIERTSELLDRLHIVVFSPEDMKIVKDDPSRRRAFIDRELCQIRPGYVNDLNQFRKVLRQRNAYLKEEMVDEMILDIWDQELVNYAARIVRQRRRFIEKIRPISDGIHNRISGGKENLTLEYETDIDREGEVCKGREEEVYSELLRSSREKDILRGATTKGPHHDDIRISIEGTDLRKFGSQGQQRTAALSLKLSEIKVIEEETGERPILLLDDVLSELDTERQKYLITSLGKNQMFITTTDLMGSVARSLPEGKVFKIRAGEIDVEI